MLKDQKETDAPQIYDTTYPILYRSRRQKERELKGNYNQNSLLNQILVKGEIDHKSTTTRIN